MTRLADYSNTQFPNSTVNRHRRFRVRRTALDPRAPGNGGMAIEVDSRNTVCVARQPILDLAGRVYGYELLYRNSSDATSCTTEGDIAGARVLSDAVFALGLDVLTNGKPA